MHQHVEPGGHARRRPGGQERRRKGLTASKPWVKTSLAPGSRVVTEYLKEAGLLAVPRGARLPPRRLRLHHLHRQLGAAAGADRRRGAPRATSSSPAVLSGNRNFEGRINPLVRMNFLASPTLVVAYALAGTVDIDLADRSARPRRDGNAGLPARHLADERADPRRGARGRQARAVQARVRQGLRRRRVVAAADGARGADLRLGPAARPTCAIRRSSTSTRRRRRSRDIAGARCLALLGDSVTTDHISPAGSISKKSPAAAYLIEHGVKPEDFNSYGARRGNHEVMMRGTFANIRLKNLMLPGVEGGMSKFLGKAGADGPQLSIYDAAMKYKDEGVPLVVLAGAEYGTGSSRDWAAKGTLLLGVRAVIAKSFERIHRSNLVGMGVLPLQFLDGEDAADARPHRPRDLRHRRRGAGPGARAHARGHGARPGGDKSVHGAAAHRYAERGRLLPARRHPAVRAAAAHRGLVDVAVGAAFWQTRYEHSRRRVGAGAGGAAAGALVRRRIRPAAGARSWSAAAAATRRACWRRAAPRWSPSTSRPRRIAEARAARRRQGVTVDFRSATCSRSARRARALRSRRRALLLLRHRAGAARRVRRGRGRRACRRRRAASGSFAPMAARAARRSRGAPELERLFARRFALGDASVPDDSVERRRGSRDPRASTRRSS